LYTLGVHTINPGETKIIQTGVAIEIPYAHVGLIWDKSSIGSKGIKVMGGVIDAGYRGEVAVVMHNLTTSSYTFEANYKVAQMLIQKVEMLDIEEVEMLDDTNRGASGFGSTGK
jgi:dUTP pyrophosphatase